SLAAGDRFAADVGDVDQGLSLLRLDVNGEHVTFIVGNNCVLLFIGNGDVGVGKSLFVEVGDAFGRIVGFKVGRDGMHRAHGDAGGAAFTGAGARVDINSEIAGGVIGVVGALDGADGSPDARLAAGLVDAGVSCDGP